MPIYRDFLAENGIFAIFRLKIRTWQTMPLKVGFIPGFRGLPTDWSSFLFSLEISQHSQQ
jgi:hypothetical protein